MGTSIELTVGGVLLSYAKNHMGNNYGFLFQEADLTRRHCDGIDYDYYKAHPDQISDLEESEETFVRSLARVVPRLLILGHSLEGARAEYEAVVADAVSLTDGEETDDEEAPLMRIPIQGGHVFRFDGGHRSNMIPATIPI